MNKKYYILVLSIFIVIVIDVLFGFAMKRLIRVKGLPGDYQKIEYLAKNTHDKVIIMGSSVVINSLNPQDIEDSLQLSCFNGACSSQTLPFFRSMVDLVAQRESTELIVLGFRPTEITNYTYSRYNMLRPYYRQLSPIVDAYLEKTNSRFELNFNLLRYNTYIWRIFLSYAVKTTALKDKGYTEHSVPKSLPVKKYESYVGLKPDINAISDLKNIIEECKEHDIKLIIYLPPQYYFNHEKGLHPGCVYLEKVCKINHIPFFNYYTDSTYLNHNDYFYDNTHLNCVGSEKFSKELTSKIKQLF